MLDYVLQVRLPEAQASLAANAGSFSFVGADATLTATTAVVLAAEQATFAVTGQDATLTATATFAQNIYDFSTDGAQSTITITGLDTMRCVVIMRDIQLGGFNDRPILRTGNGADINNGIADYEGFSENWYPSGTPSDILNNPDFSADFFAGAGPTTSLHDGIFIVEGMGNFGSKTKIRSMVSNSLDISVRNVWRTANGVEDTIEIVGENGNDFTSGTVDVLVYPETATTNLALRSMWLGAVT